MKFCKLLELLERTGQGKLGARSIDVPVDVPEVIALLYQQVRSLHGGVPQFFDVLNRDQDVSIHGYSTS